MPDAKHFFESVLVHQRQEDQDDRNAEENKKTIILMVMNIVAAERQQDGPAEPADCADHKKLLRTQMPETEDIAEEILRRSWDEKQKEDEKGALVVQEIVIFRHRLLFHELLHKGPPEHPRKHEGRKRADRKANRGKQDAESGSIDVSPDEPRDLAGNGRGNDLQDLEKNKAKERDRTERIKKRLDPLPVHKELEGPRFVKDVDQ